MNIFRRLTKSVRTYRAKLNLQRAIVMAENAHRQTGKRFYVMPGENRKLIVMDRNNFRRLRMKHYIPSDKNMLDAINVCFYYTADGSGTGISDSEREYKKDMYYRFAVK